MNVPFSRPSRHPRGQRGADSSSRGQGLVEFALILPLLAVLLVMAVDFGRVFFGWVAVTNATRIGANDAARNADDWTGGDTDDGYYARMLADLSAINCDADVNNDGVLNASDLPAPTFINRVGTADPHEFGDHVKVSLTCDFSLITPLASLVIGGGDVTVAADSTFSVIGAKINGVPVPEDPPTSPCLPTERIVPSLVGMSVAAARDRWAGAGFTGAFAPTDPAFDVDTVTSQTTTPAAAVGSCLAYYATVTVAHTAPIVCTAPQINVPNLVGLTLADARDAWSDAGFTGSFTPSAGDDAQVVLTQAVSPATSPGGCADPAATVIVTYGDAAEPPAETCIAPQLVRLSAAQAEAAWQTAGFTGSFNTQPQNKRTWIVKAQNLVGGQEYACTASVIVYLERN